MGDDGLGLAFDDSFFDEPRDRSATTAPLRNSYRPLLVADDIVAAPAADADSDDSALAAAAAIIVAAPSGASNAACRDPPAATLVAAFAKKNGPNHVAATIDRLYLARRYAEALVLCRAWLVLNSAARKPAHAHEVLDAAARCARRLRRHGDAAAFAGAAVSARSENAGLLATAAAVSAEAGDVISAVDLCGRYLKLRPNDYVAWKDLTATFLAYASNAPPQVPAVSDSSAHSSTPVHLESEPISGCDALAPSSPPAPLHTQHPSAAAVSTSAATTLAYACLARTARLVSRSPRDPAAPVNRLHDAAELAELSRLADRLAGARTSPVAGSPENASSLVQLQPPDSAAVAAAVADLGLLRDTRCAWFVRAVCVATGTDALEMTRGADDAGNDVEDDEPDKVWA
ncbi:hypothetical protein HK405_003031 [Cladochytrium tenue]|nr:hypothetical protein HK405_003031 [Cladochytrium tenue]